MKNREEVSKSILVQHQLKITSFRLKLMEVLQLAEGPISAAQIQLELLNKKFRNFDRATLFRNLKSMEQAGLLESTEFGQGAHFYYLKKAKGPHEHHVFCIKCEKTQPIKGCGAKASIEKAQEQGYQVLSHRVELMGICPECA